jgi:hypothetical protein
MLWGRTQPILRQPFGGCGIPWFPLRSAAFALQSSVGVVRFEW